MATNDYNDWFKFGFDHNKAADKVGVRSFLERFNIEHQSDIQKGAAIYLVQKFCTQSRPNFDVDYLAYGFDPSKYSMPRIQQLLAYHNIRYESGAKKDRLVAFFNENIGSMRAESGVRAPPDQGFDDLADGMSSMAVNEQHHQRASSHGRQPYDHGHTQRELYRPQVQHAPQAPQFHHAQPPPLQQQYAHTESEQFPTPQRLAPPPPPRTFQQPILQHPQAPTPQMQQYVHTTPLQRQAQQPFSTPQRFAPPPPTQSFQQPSLQQPQIPPQQHDAQQQSPAPHPHRYAPPPPPAPRQPWLEHSQTLPPSQQQYAHTGPMQLGAPPQSATPRLQHLQQRPLPAHPLQRRSNNQQDHYATPNATFTSGPQQQQAQQEYMHDPASPTPSSAPMLGCDCHSCHSFREQDSNSVRRGPQPHTNAHGESGTGSTLATVPAGQSTRTGQRQIDVPSRSHLRYFRPVQQPTPEPEVFEQARHDIYEQTPLDIKSELLGAEDAYSSGGRRATARYLQRLACRMNADIDGPAASIEN
jgi:hypothetical protein